MVSKGKEDFEKIAILFEFYGNLLPEKQFTAMDLYYNQDLSLSEISYEMGVTRQAVHDAIKHAKETLINYEEKLSMVDKVLSLKTVVKNLNTLIDSFDGNSKELKMKLNEIKKELMRLED